jgi:hypothetical protein
MEPQQHIHSVAERNKQSLLASLSQEKNAKEANDLVLKYQALFGKEGDRNQLQHDVWEDMKMGAGFDRPSCQPASPYPTDWHDGLRTGFLNIRNIVETKLQITKELTETPTQPQTAIT